MSTVDPVSVEQPMRPVIRYSRVGVSFPDGTTALDGVDLTVSSGEVVAVVGPSGCGKSTLLRVAAGLTPCTTGSCEADVMRAAHVFQDATLMPWRNILRNVELPAELRGVDRHIRRTSARRALDLVGLPGVEEKYPSQLSGGMRMRVSLARALTLEPEVLLLDEPFGALDEFGRETLQDEFGRIFAERRCSAVLVTHSVSEAAYLADRVVCLSPAPGRIVAEFTVPFEHPRPATVRYDHGFVDLCARVSAALKRTTGGGPS